MTFREYINGRLFDSMSLFHDEEEIEEYTLCEFGLASFTDAGLEYWKDVLDANIVSCGRDSIYEIDFAYVNGVSAERVEELQMSHAGYCSDKDWHIWFKMEE